MHNTVGDDALTNIGGQTKYFPAFNLYIIQNKSSSSCFSLKYVLSMFFNFETFSTSYSYKKKVYTSTFLCTHCLPDCQGLFSSKDAIADYTESLGCFFTIFNLSQYVEV